MKSLIAGVSVLLVMTLQAETLQDPTRPTDYTPSSAASTQTPKLSGSMEWKLSAIRISPDMRKAIVNGRLVQEGERVGEATVANISSGSVVLNYRGQEIKVNLVPQDVKIVRGD
ncbi:MAG: general secretion pathway protein GspB [Pseudomonadales bacterium]